MNKSEQLIEKVSSLTEGTARMQDHRNASKLHLAAAQEHDKCKDDDEPSKEAKVATSKAFKSTNSIKDTYDMKNNAGAHNAAEHAKETSSYDPVSTAKYHRQASKFHLAAAGNRGVTVREKFDSLHAFKKDLRDNNIPHKHETNEDPDNTHRDEHTFRMSVNHIDKAKNLLSKHFHKDPNGPFRTHENGEKVYVTSRTKEEDSSRYQ